MPRSDERPVWAVDVDLLDGRFDEGLLDLLGRYHVAKLYLRIHLKFAQVHVF